MFLENRTQTAVEAKLQQKGKRKEKGGNSPRYLLRG